MTDWERGFVDSLRRQIERDRPTRSRSETLDNCWERATARGLRSPMRFCAEVVSRFQQADSAAQREHAHDAAVPAPMKTGPAFLKPTQETTQRRRPVPAGGLPVVIPDQAAKGSASGCRFNDGRPHVLGERPHSPTTAPTIMITMAISGSARPERRAVQEVPAACGCRISSTRTTIPPPPASASSTMSAQRERPPRRRGLLPLLGLLDGLGTACRFGARQPLHPRRRRPVG